MRGAAFLTGIRDGIVMDVGGTTCDIGALSNGFPRESTVAVDIGGVRTNFRMPDILAIGLGGGTRIHIDADAYGAGTLSETGLRVGPDSVGYKITRESYIFGGTTLTASDIAVATGRAHLGDPSSLPALGADVCTSIWGRLQDMLSEGLDRMKTAPGDTTIVAVGGANFLVGDTLKGAADVVRPPHAGVANAVGAAIAQIGAQVEQIIDYNANPRDRALAELREEAVTRVISAGGKPGSIEIVDVDEVFLSYLPGRSAQIRVKAVGDLSGIAPTPLESDPGKLADARHAY
jgi:N-methylhydantoinase A/oxoprolinase/acetone carboxylase beta subunit